jgi:lactate racemase
MPPISESVKEGDKVTIVFPDRVKGGTHPTAHRIVSIPLVLEELRKAGVRQKDIKLICSNGLHRKNTPEEIRSLLGPRVFRRVLEHQADREPRQRGLRQPH